MMSLLVDTSLTQIRKNRNSVTGACWLRRFTAAAMEDAIWHLQTGAITLSAKVGSEDAEPRNTLGSAGRLRSG
jgi:hypothetical protein